MYQIAIEEHLVNVHVETPTREELIALLMKYRGVKASYCIDKYNKNGLVNVQELLIINLARGFIMRIRYECHTRLFYTRSLI